MANQEVKISYLAKEETVCPVCEHQFRVEKMLTGRGRLNAGDLGVDLRRYYLYNQDFPIVNPLMFFIVVCPKCLCACFPDDFKLIKGHTYLISEIKKERERRDSFLHAFDFLSISFLDSRTLVSGAISFLLAAENYKFFPEEYSPTVKQALCFLRASWLFSTCLELYSEDKNLFNKMYEYAYDKTLIFFEKAATEIFDHELQGEFEFYFGPDLDKDFKYNGFVYISSYFIFLWSKNLELEKRMDLYLTLKNRLSKVFGLGVKSMSKAGSFLDLTKNLYDQINQALKEGEQK